VVLTAISNSVLDAKSNDDDDDDDDGNHDDDDSDQHLVCGSPTSEP